MIHTSSWWSLETAGWAVDTSDDSTALTPGDLPDEAALVISAFRKPSGHISPEELWIVSGKASPAHAKRSPVECGAFAGYAASYGDDDGLHWRVWWLAYENLHVYATFNCPEAHAGDHDVVLDWMLSSLSAVSNAC
jgi:hypothetical protein